MSFPPGLLSRFDEAMKLSDDTATQEMIRNKNERERDEMIRNSNNAIDENKEPLAPVDFFTKEYARQAVKQVFREAKHCQFASTLSCAQLLNKEIEAACRKGDTEVVFEVPGMPLDLLQLVIDELKAQGFHTSLSADLLSLTVDWDAEDLLK